MRRLYADDEQIKGYTHVGSLFGGVVVAAVGLLVAIVFPTFLGPVL